MTKAPFRQNFRVYTRDRAALSRAEPSRAARQAALTVRRITRLHSSPRACGNFIGRRAMREIRARDYLFSFSFRRFERQFVLERHTDIREGD